MPYSCIHVPTLETTRPNQKRRKSRYASAAKAEVRPGSTSEASSSPSASSSGASSALLAVNEAVTARVHGSRTHHGTCHAPSTVLKTAACTGKRALSCELPKKLAITIVAEGRQ